MFIPTCFNSVIRRENIKSPNVQRGNPRGKKLFPSERAYVYFIFIEEDLKSFSPVQIF